MGGLRATRPPRVQRRSASATQRQECALDGDSAVDYMVMCRGSAPDSRADEELSTFSTNLGAFSMSRISMSRAELRGGPLGWCDDSDSAVDEANEHSSFDFPITVPPDRRTEKKQFFLVKGQSQS